MNEQLEKLIDLALADGILTDKEKEVLHRKATELGVDQDEFEMILSGKLTQKQNEINTSTNSVVLPPPPLEKPKSSKHGDIKKCPSCGSPIESLKTKCPDCGHEFRNIDSNNSVKELEEKLSKIKFNEDDISDSAQKKIINIIKNHPIPNSKEDLFEMLTYMSGKVLASSDVGVLGDDITHAYHSRALEVINKLMFMSDLNPAILKRVEDIQTKMEKHKKKNSYKSAIIGIGAFILAIILFKLIWGPIMSLFN